MRVERYAVDGGGLERWLLKTIIGTAFEHETISGEIWQTPIEWVDIVFGVSRFPDLCGLYMGDFRLAQVDLESSRLAIEMLTRGNGQIDGAKFDLDGWGMVLALAPLQDDIVTYRPRFVRDRDGIRLQQVISFEWPPASR